MPAVTCPECSNPLKLLDAPSGRTVTCPSWNTQISMPFHSPGRTCVDPSTRTPSPATVFPLYLDREVSLPARSRRSFRVADLAVMVVVLIVVAGLALWLAK